MTPQEKLEREKHLYLTFVFHAVSLADLTDLLGADWVKQDTKMRSKHFFEAFERNNKKNLELLFNVATDENENRGDAYLQGQAAVESMAHTLAEIPYHKFPDIVDLIRGYMVGTVVFEKDFVKVKEGEK